MIMYLFIYFEEKIKKRLKKQNNRPAAQDVHNKADNSHVKDLTLSVNL